MNLKDEQNLATQWVTGRGAMEQRRNGNGIRNVPVRCQGQDQCLPQGPC